MKFRLNVSTFLQLLVAFVLFFHSVNFAQVTAGGGVFLRSFYQL